MPEVHVPKLEDEGHDTPAVMTTGASAAHGSRAKSSVKLLLEVALIATGVFLGLAGEQWRESRAHRELAEAALRRFKTELTANRAAVADVVDYHESLAKEIKAYLRAKGDERLQTPVHLRGIRFAALEHTAWDLALATQALNHIDQDLAFAISHVYVTQNLMAGLNQGMTQAMYLQPPSAGIEPFLRSLDVYYGDVNVYEPALLKMYDELIPRLDGAGDEGHRAAR